jgi:peptide/nickel transport system substrate-binding protein
LSADCQLTRRAFVAAAMTGAFAPRIVRARGRSPAGGKISLRLPWPIFTIDPHRIDDVGAAIFGDALFGTLYARDDAGNVTPSLAEGDPEVDGADLRVRVRSGLTTAQGRPLDARDAASSIARARASGAQAWLADIPAPTRIDATTLRFTGRDAAKLVRALSSPLTAILPLAFSPDHPDGTGPFRAEKREGALALMRNPKAADGASFLEEITVRAASDLATSLRSFEAGTDDVGWLGLGLHEPRVGAKSFDCGAVAWAILRTGREGGNWDMPGVVQRVADGIPSARLSYLAIGAPWATEREEGWNGSPADLLVRDDSPWLVELARTVAATLSRPSHELTARPLPASEFQQRLRLRSFALAIDVARPLAPGAIGALTGLATADNAQQAMELVRHPPRVTDAPARTLTRMLRIGILGEIRVQGGRIPDLALPTSPSGWDLGAATRLRKTQAP